MMPPSSIAVARSACVLLLLCAGCLHRSPKTPPPAAREATPASLSGCYALYTLDGRSIDGRFYRAPARVQLDTTRLTEIYFPGVFRRLVRLDAAGHSMDDREAPFSPWWTHDTGGFLVLSFSDGFSGAALTLAAPLTGDTVRGVIDENWDFGPPFTVARGGAYAVRIPCRTP